MHNFTPQPFHIKFFYIILLLLARVCVHACKCECVCACVRACVCICMLPQWVSTQWICTTCLILVHVYELDLPTFHHVLHKVLTSFLRICTLKTIVIIVIINSFLTLHCTCPHDLFAQWITLQPLHWWMCTNCSADSSSHNFNICTTNHATEQHSLSADSNHFLFCLRLVL